MNDCQKCGDRFIGDKRAVFCADCAYAPSAIPEAARTETGDDDLVNEVGLLFLDAMSVKCVASDHARATIAMVRRHDEAHSRERIDAPKPAPGQGELHYYTLGHNADRVCTRCEFNLSADARDHQWVHDQKRDEAVRAERVACEKVARHTAENCKSSTGYAIALGIADAIRARATTGEKEGGVSEK